VAFWVESGYFAGWSAIFIAKSGALGVAIAHLLTAMIMSIFYFGLMIRTLQFRIRSLVARIYRPIFAVVCMYFSVELAMSVHVKSTGKIMSIPIAAGLIMTGTCAYLFSIVLFWLAAGRPCEPKQV